MRLAFSLISAVFFTLPTAHAQCEWGVSDILDQWGLKKEWSAHAPLQEKGPVEIGYREKIPETEYEHKKFTDSEFKKFRENHNLLSFPSHDGNPIWGQKVSVIPSHTGVQLVQEGYRSQRNPEKGYIEVDHVVALSVHLDTSCRLQSFKTPSLEFTTQICEQAWSLPSHPKDPVEELAKKLDPKGEKRLRFNSEFVRAVQTCREDGLMAAFLPINLDRMPASKKEDKAK